MKKLETIDKRKVFGTVFGVVGFILCVLFFTYAWYNWRSGNTTVNLGIEDVSVNIEFTMGPDVNATGIGPVLDYNDGVKTDFTVTNNASSNFRLFVSLNITSITSTLQVGSFKYKLLKDTSGGTNYTTEVASGDFSTFGEGINLITSEDIIAANSVCTYQFIVYIDGTIDNDIDMREDILISTLIVSDELITSVPSSTFIQDLYNDGSDLETINIGNDSDNPSVTLNDNQGILLDNNGDYRYYGADPNNYVSFNGELWRIIGVGNVKSSESDTTGENRIKIVKATPLTDDNDLSLYSWDSSATAVNSGYGVNNWASADLNTELNNLYYNSTSGVCYNGGLNANTECDFTDSGLSQDARDLISNALYYLGGIGDNYNTLFADGLYDVERGTSVYSCSASSCGGERSTSWSGILGLMYPSDYAYATDLSVCFETVANYSNSQNCYGKNWLLNYSASDSVVYGMITPSSTSPTNVSMFFSVGAFVNNFEAIVTSKIYPVVYLNSDVVILEGEGTSGNPYQIGTSSASDVGN